MKRFCENRKFCSISHPDPLCQDLSSSSSAAILLSCSSKSAFDQIMEALKNDQIQNIGLYGEAGIGKTMLAEQVLKEAKNLFDRVIMVNVSQNQQVKSIQGVLADFLDLALEQESQQGRASQLHRRLLNREKILLILDDVWKEFNFSAVGIPSGGCKILLTSLSSSHVPDCMQTQRDVQLAILSEDEAWALFQSITSFGDQVRMDDVAKNAILECKGLPKSVVKLGRALRSKHPSEWEDSLYQLREPRLKIIEDVKEQAKKLSLSRNRVNSEIEMAKSNAQEIYEDVQNWLKDVERVLEDMEKFMNELNQNKSCFDECDGLNRMKADEFMVIANKVCEDGRFDQVVRPTFIHQSMSLSSSGDFMPSKAACSAFSDITGALKKDGMNMIGLYGMGGIGKTTLAKQVRKEVHRLKIFDHAVMATVSQSPQVRRIQGTIADFLNLRLEQETEDGRAEKLKQRLKDEKILIILDDVWKKFDLTSIGISLNECRGCKVLLTTRRRDVCTSMDCQINIQLNLLSKDEAEALLKKKAGLSNELKLNGVAKQIVEECNCLPIALTTVGAALKNKGEDEWREALDNLKKSRLVDIVGVDSDERNAYRCLRLSYDYLKYAAQAHQAQFILLLCSLFPEDYEIKLEDLTRFVFGMELFECVESIEDARRKVRVTIRFLKDSCLLLGGDDKEHVKIHDVVRDAVLWIGGTESQKRKKYRLRLCVIPLLCVHG